MASVLTLNGNMLTFGGNALMTGVDPYNPLNLPAYTVRCKYAQGYTPSKGTTQTLVDAAENVWDIYSTNWVHLLSSDSNLISIIGANGSNVADMSNMCYDCRSLVSVCLFDTRDCQNTTGMFTWCPALVATPRFDLVACLDARYMYTGCSSLTEIPTLNLGVCRNVDGLFSNCTNVQTGALALYQQLSAQASITSHRGTFYLTGSETESGSQELAQIPITWKDR